MPEGSVLGCLFLVGAIATWYAVTRTEADVAQLVDRLGRGMATAVLAALGAVALPVVGALPIVLVPAIARSARSFCELGARTLRYTAFAGFVLWCGLLVQAHIAGKLPIGTGSPKPVAADQTAAEPEQPNDRSENAEVPPGRPAGRLPLEDELGLPNPLVPPTTRRELEGTELDIDELLRKAREETTDSFREPPWKRTDASATKLPEPQLPPVAGAPEPLFPREPSRPPSASGPPRTRRPPASTPAARPGQSVLDRYRQGNLPNTYAAVLTAWGEALQELDRDVLAELTHPKARGILRRVADKTIDDVTLKGLRARYARARHIRWLSRSSGEYVAVVRLGGVFGPQVQFVCRLYQGKWRLYQIQDAGLSEFLRLYKLQEETPLGPVKSEDEGENGESELSSGPPD